MSAVGSAHDDSQPFQRTEPLPSAVGDGGESAHLPTREARGLAPVPVRSGDAGDSAGDRTGRDPLLVAMIPPERLGTVCDWVDRTDWEHPKDACTMTSQWTAVWSCGHLSHFCDEHQKDMQGNVGNGERVYCDWLGEALGHDMTLVKWVRL